MNSDSSTPVPRPLLHFGGLTRYETMAVFSATSAIDPGQQFRLPAAQAGVTFRTVGRVAVPREYRKHPSPLPSFENAIVWSLVCAAASLGLLAIGLALFEGIEASAKVVEQAEHPSDKL